MAHWEHRPEENWKKFRFNQPYQKGLKRLKEEVLAKTDFDPATLWQWGTMQAMAVIRILEECERVYGEKGQRLVGKVLREVGRDVGKQILHNVKRPEGLSDAEFMSFFATVINRVVYASLEEPTIESDDLVSFHITWCPHQDHYRAFDCRVQRYFVQGMMEAFKEASGIGDWQVRFTRTIPAGSSTCHFELWRAAGDEKSEWEKYTESLEKRALRMAREQPLES